MNRKEHKAAKLVSAGQLPDMMKHVHADNHTAKTSRMAHDMQISEELQCALDFMRRLFDGRYLGTYSAYVNSVWTS